MAIPCEMCGKPVHEQTVVCPHCGDRTGNPADPEAARRIEEMPALAATEATPPVASAIIDVLGSAVDAALGLLAGEPETKLPRAVARETPSRSPCPASSRRGPARRSRSRSGR